MDFELELQYMWALHSDRRSRLFGHGSHLLIPTWLVYQNTIKLVWGSPTKTIKNICKTKQTTMHHSWSLDMTTSQWVGPLGASTREQRVSKRLSHLYSMDNSWKFWENIVVTIPKLRNWMRFAIELEAFDMQMLIGRAMETPNDQRRA